MTKKNVTVSFGGKQVIKQINEIDTLDEAKREFSPNELLALINYAYRLKQLRNIRKDLERHPRNEQR